MTIGFIFECGPQGADKQVCEYLAGQLRPGVAFVSKTMDNKLKLLEGAASVAKKLLTEEGCKKVLIVWDLRPAWPDKKDKPCRAKERQTLLDALAKTGLHNAPSIWCALSRSWRAGYWQATMPSVLFYLRLRIHTPSDG